MLRVVSSLTMIVLTTITMIATNTGTDGFLSQAKAASAQRVTQQHTSCIHIRLYANPQTRVTFASFIFHLVIIIMRGTK